MLVLKLKVNGDNKLKESGIRVIDKSLHFSLQHAAYDGRHTNLFEVDHFLNRKMTVSQLNFVERCIDGKCFALNPERVGYGGCRVGFSVYKALHEGDAALLGKSKERVLTFIEEQLPRGKDYDYMAKIFMKDVNIKLLESIGLPMPNINRAEYALF